MKYLYKYPQAVYPYTDLVETKRRRSREELDFHGDNGAGLGASHQTGWTGLIALSLDLFARVSQQDALQIRKDSLLTKRESKQPVSDPQVPVESKRDAVARNKSE